MAYSCRCFTRILKENNSLRRCVLNVSPLTETRTIRTAAFSTSYLNRTVNYDNRSITPVVEASDNDSNLKRSRNCSYLHTSSTHRRVPYSSNNENETDQSHFTHFGYDLVEENEKINKVYEVFENVASSYDLMNDAMSMGVHRLWKAKFVDQLNVKPRMQVLDMAGGTADIAFKVLDSFSTRFPKMASEQNFPGIVIGDINKEMLEVGQQRAEKLGIKDCFQWVETNAEELPFEDETFDLYTIAFGIRNTTHIDRVLDEAFRVLKIGGRLSCLEFSSVGNSVINELYELYSFDVIPVMGKVLAGDWESYQYLVESIRKFPTQNEFAEMFYEAGFSNVRYENLTFGVVAIHDGFKI